MKEKKIVSILTQKFSKVISRPFERMVDAWHETIFHPISEDKVLVGGTLSKLKILEKQLDLDNLDDD